LRPVTPIMNFTRCILQNTTHSIHGKYLGTLRRAVSALTFREYLFKKHQWTMEVFEEVDWQAFHVAERNYASTDVHLLKLVHGLLPTRSHTARFQPWTSSSCHYCDTPETLVHLQCGRCNSVSSQFRAKLIESLRKYFARNHSPAEFQQVFITAMEQWLDGRASYDRSQSRIGWHLFTRGFLSMQWRHFFVFTSHLEKWNTALTAESEDLLEELEIDFQDDTSTTTDTSVGTQYEKEQSTATDLDTTLLHNSNLSSRTVDPFIFTAGLIKTIWLKVGTLWRTHWKQSIRTQLYLSLQSSLPT
jgi:hypothetical protein